MRILLVWLILWPLFGADFIEAQERRREFLRELERVENSVGSLIGAAGRAELPIPPVILQRLYRLCDQFVEVVGTVEDPHVHGPTADAVWRSAGDMENGASRVVEYIRQYATQAKGLKSTPNSAALQRQYVEPMSAMVAGMMEDLATSAYFRRSAEENWTKELRWHQLLFASKLAANQQLLSSEQVQVPVGGPRGSDFLVWCRSARARIDLDLSSPPAGNVVEAEKRYHQMTESMALPEQRLESWEELMWVIKRRLDAGQPPIGDNDGTGLQVLRNVLDQQAESLRQTLSILADQETLTPGASAELDRLRSERAHCAEVEQAATHAVDWQSDFAGSRKELSGKVAACSEKVRKEIASRLEQIAADATRQQSRLLKAVADRDRVGATETEGEFELINIRLAALKNEFESEIFLAEAETVWRAREKEPALRETARQFLDHREKIRGAFATEQRLRLEQQLVKNRIALLQLKESIVDDQVRGAEVMVGRLRNELDQMRKNLDGVGAKVGAKDAERIPLVKPGVDDF